MDSKDLETVVNRAANELDKENLEIRHNGETIKELNAVNQPTTHSNGMRHHVPTPTQLAILQGALTCDDSEKKRILAS